MIKRIVVAALLGVVIGVGGFLSVKNVNDSLVEATGLNVQTPSTPAAEEKVEDQEVFEETPSFIDLTGESIVLLLGPIRHNTKEVAMAIKQAAREGKRVWLLIDSPGGSVIAGAQIVTAIETAGVEVNTVCLSLCASMAAIIHQYGTNRYMVDRSFLMFHEASGGAEGTVPQMLSQLTTMNRYINKMLAQIAKRAGMTFKEFDSKLAAELWLDAEESLQQKFSDGMLNVYYNEQDAINPPKKESGLFFFPSGKVKVEY